MPAGELKTLPEPVPVLFTASLNVTVGLGTASKLAVTAWSWLNVRSQLSVPLQAPDQPVKTEPSAGVAIRLTLVASSKFMEQVVPQSMPAGSLITVPEPVPDLLTLRMKVGLGVGSGSLGFAFTSQEKLTLERSF